METQIEALLQHYPQLDRMMAETLLAMHEQGTLTEYMGRLAAPPTSRSAEETVVRGALQISAAEE